MVFEMIWHPEEVRYRLSKEKLASFEKWLLDFSE